LLTVLRAIQTSSNDDISTRELLNRVKMTRCG
jgi:hypothetical protein